MLKISAFYYVKQKSFIPKKNMIYAFVNIKTKKLCLLTQFSATVLIIAIWSKKWLSRQIQLKCAILEKPF